MKSPFVACCTRALLALVLPAMAAAASAQEYPSRPLNLIMPYSAGTGIDIATRSLGDQLRQRIGQPVIVQNKVGAAGNIGTETVVRATPDGYTLLVVANTLAINPSLYQNLSYDPVADLTPVSLLFKGAMVLVAGQGVAAQSLPEFLEAARKAPGQFNYASAGVGTPQHLAMELLKSNTGADVVHVPHKGAGDAVISIAGGQVEIGFVPIQSALVQIASGRMHALAVSSPERHPALPQVQTVSEAIGQPFDVDLWYGLFAPAGTPDAVVARLNREAREALAQSQIQEQLATQGMLASTSSPQELATLLQDDMARWREVIVSNNIRTE